MRDIDEYSNKYTEEPFESTMVKIRKKVVIEQCDKYKHDNILEIGCGMMPYFLDYKDYKKMVIVEPSSKFADNAEAIAAKEGRDVIVLQDFFESAVDKIKELNIEFDYIILSSVLHELDDPHIMLEQIKQVCGDNTVVHINVPNANSLHRLIAIELGMIKDVHEQSAQMQKMQRRRTYDKDMLADEMTKAGFQIIDQNSYFVKPFTHAQMQKCMDNGIINDDILLGLEKVVKYMPDLGAGIYVNVKKMC